MKKRERTYRKRGPDPVDLSAGTALRTIRLCRGMSQAKLAEGLGVSFQQVQKYEQGKNRMAASTLYYASLIFDVPIIEFFEGLDGVSPKSKHFRLSKDEMGLLSAYREIQDTADRKHIRKIVESIAGGRLE